MSRDTTVDAWKEINENGLLGKLQTIVYNYLYRYGPMTANEMRVALGGSSNSGVYSTRLSELEKRGVVTTDGKRPCKTTGKMAYEWRIVKGKLPLKLDKPKKLKCPHCDGKGYKIETQTRMF